MPAEEIANWMLARRPFALVPRQVHVKAHKHLICLRARGSRTMICLKADQHGLQGLQTYDMFASTWLAKISYVCKLRKIIPFLFLGIGPLHRVQIGIPMIGFG